MDDRIDVVVDAKATLGEGAFWDGEKQVLYWVDIEGMRLFLYHPKERRNVPYEIGEKIGTVVPRRSGGLLLALKNSLAKFDPETATLRVVAPFEAEIPENRSNDGKCDPAGRFWVGSMAPDSKPGTASLYCVEADYKTRRVLTGVTISNGIAWTADNRTMYYVDTPSHHVYSFDYDLETGGICNQRVCIDVPEEFGFPDGMTIDEEGMLWVALFGGGGVSRWDPRKGRLLQHIRMPTKNITSCSFGGERLDELYVTSARILLSEEELADQEYAGALFCVRPDVRGVSLNVFAG